MRIPSRILMAAYCDLLRPAFRELGKAFRTAVAILNLLLAPVRWFQGLVELTIDGDLVRRRRLLSKKSDVVDPQPVWLTGSDESLALPHSLVQLSVRC